MTKCILHIGMNKTGTSSIQSTFFRNRKVLQKSYKIDYFSAFKNHSKLKPIFEQKKYPPGTLERRNQGEHHLRKIKALKTQLVRELYKAGKNTFVISGEGLSEISPEGLSTLKETLDPYISSYTIIIYVKEPFSYARSNAQQQIKAGATFEQIKSDTFEGIIDSKEKFIDHKGVYRPRYTLLPRYRFRIEKYQKLFGTENVVIRDFRPASFEKNCVVRNFMSLAFPDQNLRKKIKIIRSNESIDMRQAMILESINRQFPIMQDNKKNPNRCRNQMLPFLQMRRKGKYELFDFDYESYVDLIREDVEWLSHTTKREIQYNLNATPASTDVSRDHQKIIKSNWDEQARLENEKGLIANYDAIKEQFSYQIRRLDKRGIFHAQFFYKLIRNCTDISLLLDMAQQLKARDKMPEAFLAVKRIRVLGVDDVDLKKQLRLLVDNYEEEYDYSRWYDNLA